MNVEREVCEITVYLEDNLDVFFCGKLDGFEVVLNIKPLILYV